MGFQSSSVISRQEQNTLYLLFSKSYQKVGTDKEKKITTTKFLLPSAPLPILPIFFFFHTERYFSGVFFFFESSGLKILGHLGILRASGRSGAEHREVLGRPRQRGLRWSMCLGEGGLRGAKEATYIFRRKNKNEEKKKSVTEACLAHTPALGAGSGGARGGERLGGWK